MLSEKTQNDILALKKLYPVARSAIIPALHLAQAEHGYLPSSLQAEVAEMFGIGANEVHSLVTFYDMFYEEPVGKHIIHVCKNISCMLRGCDRLLAQVGAVLGVEPGGTTSDGEFTLIASECLAACDKAPVMLIDDQIVGPVQDDDLKDILSQAKKRPGHAPQVSESEALDG